MDLCDYLYKQKKLNGLTIRKFAELLNYSREHINQVVNGKLIPSKKLAQKIVDATNGNVTLHELYAYYAKMQKKNIAA